jgi:hygromycin-B 7''-O-kinase
MLHQNFTPETYWQSIYKQPLPEWLPALEAIRERHNLPRDEWSRFSLGRNVVFGLGRYVVKLCPPFWVDDAEREIAALTFIHNRLPVATPELVATGEQDGWRYLVQVRLPGELLWSFWFSLDPAQKVTLARQHGQIMRALHDLPAANAPIEIGFDWAEMLAAQEQACAHLMQQSQLPEALLADLEPYLVQARPLLAAGQGQAVLHGDLNALNFLVEPHGSGWRMTGLVDWGDVKLGPITHEFISPGVHMYRGERAALLAWYDGYGLLQEQRIPSFEQDIMTRTMLYYAGDFKRLLALVPGANSCYCWADVAACLWHLAAGRSV